MSKRNKKYSPHQVEMADILLLSRISLWTHVLAYPDPHIYNEYTKFALRNFNARPKPPGEPLEGMPYSIALLIVAFFQVENCVSLWGRVLFHEALSGSDFYLKGGQPLQLPQFLLPLNCIVCDDALGGESASKQIVCGLCKGNDWRVLKETYKRAYEGITKIAAASTQKEFDTELGAIAAGYRILVERIERPYKARFQLIQQYEKYDPQHWFIPIAAYEGQPQPEDLPLLEESTKGQVIVSMKDRCLNDMTIDGEIINSRKETLDLNKLKLLMPSKR